MSSFSKLDFSRVRLVGRAEEVAQMRDIYQQVLRNDNEEASHVLLISGYSGCGKSRLVDAFVNKIASSDSSSLFHYVSGKYQQASQIMEPFSGIKLAFANLCSQLLDDEKDKAVRFETAETNATEEEETHFDNALGAELKGALGKDIALLIRMVPELRYIVGTPSGGSDHDNCMEGDDDEILDDSETALQRVFSAFRVLVQSVIKTTDRPLIILLDDIQWMDRGSLEVIKRLTVDKDSSRLLLIGAYRNNEISDEMQKVFEALKQKDPRFVHSIELGNLTKWSIQEILADLLRRDEADTASLAELILERTQGNAFFVLQYISILQTIGLELNIQTYKWTWNVEKIRQSTQITSNVVDLLLAKMKRLSLDAQRCLLVAASGCWAKITFEQLSKLMVGLGTEIDLQVNLDKLVEDGHLAALPRGKGFTFVHDRIKEAAYALDLEGLEKERLHYTIGNIFRTNQDCDSSLFVAADQYRRSLSLIVDEKEKVDLARLYLDVGQKSRSFAAFSCAVAYLGTGLQLVKSIDNAWSKYYALHLELSQSIADPLWCLGRHEELQELVNDILQNATSLDDKLDAYYALAQSYGAQEKIKEALEVELTVLKELKWFPKRFKIGTVLVSVASLKRQLKKKSVAEIAAMPRTENRRIMQASRLLMLVCKHAGSFSDDITQTLSIIMRLKMALKHGICDSLISTFAQFGIILSAMFDDVKEGARLGEMSMELDRKYGGRLYCTWTYFAIYIYYKPWYSPLQDTVKPLAEAYRKGLKVGDVELAMCSFMGSSVHHFISGLGLRSLFRDVRSILETCQEFNQNAVIALLRPLYHSVTRLTGNESPKDRWAIDDEEEFLLQAEGNKMRIYYLHLYKMMTDFYFGDAESAMKSLKLAKIHSTTAFTFFDRTTLAFFQALVPLTLAMQTKDAKNIRMAKSGIKKMEKMARRQSKALNLAHKIQILEAGMASLSKQASRNDVLAKFDKAIALSARTGMLQDTAVVKLLAHQFFHETCRDDDSESEFYLESALVTFEDWGATALTHKRQGRRPTAMPTQPMTSSSGKERHTVFNDVRTISIMRRLDEEEARRRNSSVQLTIA